MGGGANTLSQTTGQRAGSVHLVKKLCSFFLLDIQNIHGEQAGKRDRGGSAVGVRHIVREHDTHTCFRSTALLKVSFVEKASMDQNHEQLTNQGSSFYLDLCQSGVCSTKNSLLQFIAALVNSFCLHSKSRFRGDYGPKLDCLRFAKILYKKASSRSSRSEASAYS